MTETDLPERLLRVKNWLNAHYEHDEEELLRYTRRLGNYYTAEQLEAMRENAYEKPKVLVVESDPKFIRALKSSDAFYPAEGIFIPEAIRACRALRDNAPHVRLVLVALESVRSFGKTEKTVNFEVMKSLRNKFPGFLVVYASREKYQFAFPCYDLKCDSIIPHKKDVPREVSSLLFFQEEILLKCTSAMGWPGLVHTFLRLNDSQQMSWGQCLAHLKQTMH